MHPARLRQRQVCLHQALCDDDVVVACRLRQGMLEFQVPNSGTPAICLCDGPTWTGGTAACLPYSHRSCGGVACWQKLVEQQLALTVALAVQTRGRAAPDNSATMAAWGRKPVHEG